MLWCTLSISYSYNVLNKKCRKCIKKIKKIRNHRPHSVSWLGPASSRIGYLCLRVRVLIFIIISILCFPIPSPASSSSSFSSNNSNIVCLSGLWQNFACHVVIMVPYPFRFHRPLVTDNPLSLLGAPSLYERILWLTLFVYYFALWSPRGVCQQPDIHRHYRHLLSV